VNIKQTVYFMGLVGGLAGLACWAIQAWLSESISVQQEQLWVWDALSTTLMGALIGGMTVGFADQWSGEGVVARWVLVGVMLGTLAGFGAGILDIPIYNNIIVPNWNSPVAAIGRSLTWAVAGGLIGLVTGFRWLAVNPLRPLHALLGGLVGGALGGAVSLLGWNEFIQPLPFMLTGLGITLGVTLAPVLLRDGVLHFVSSADARAQNKYGRQQPEWVVQDGDRLAIGSQGSDRTMTLYARGVDVYIPDAMIAPLHATLFAKAKRFFIQVHEDNTGPQGQPLNPLQVNGALVVGTRELHDGDQIVLGQTLLQFRSRRQAAPVHPSARLR